MSALSFDVELRWTHDRKSGIGEIRTDNAIYDVSTPKAMGGRGVGTNPEELLVSAVASCFSATLYAVLQRAHLPVDSLKVAARGTVRDYPTRSRFAGVVVSPTILGADPRRRAEYETSALRAHARCLIRRALASDVTYELGPIHVQREAALTEPQADLIPKGENVLPSPGGSREQALAWRSGE
ncbi:MAG: OsmC family protein [Solirubrobacteraceae bacterium]